MIIQLLQLLFALLLYASPISRSQWPPHQLFSPTATCQYGVFLHKDKAPLQIVRLKPICIAPLSAMSIVQNTHLYGSNTSYKSTISNKVTPLLEVAWIIILQGPCCAWMRTIEQVLDRLGSHLSNSIICVHSPSLPTAIVDLEKLRYRLDIQNVWRVRQRSAEVCGFIRGHSTVVTPPDLVFC